jgi:hypothetical protein
VDRSESRRLLEGLVSTDVEECVRAATRLHECSTEEDVPWLLELLEHESFFVREAAAWPLAELCGYDHLRALFRAYQRGFDEGHDNDGFTAALIECATLHRSRTKTALNELAKGEDAQACGHAEWLLEFCQDP